MGTAHLPQIAESKHENVPLENIASHFKSRVLLRCSLYFGPLNHKMTHVSTTSYQPTSPGTVPFASSFQARSNAKVVGLNSGNLASELIDSCRITTNSRNIGIRRQIVESSRFYHSWHNRVRN